MAYANYVLYISDSNDFDAMVNKEGLLNKIQQPLHHKDPSCINDLSSELLIYDE